MQAASDALEEARDKKDALYARLDDIADALGCDRDEVIDLIDDASDIDADNDDIHPVKAVYKRQTSSTRIPTRASATRATTWTATP